MINCEFIKKLHVKYVGDPTYAGTYRTIYTHDGSRFLQVRGLMGGFKTIKSPIPSHVKNTYSAAVHFGV